MRGHLDADYGEEGACYDICAEEEMACDDDDEYCEKEMECEEKMTMPKRRMMKAAFDDYGGIEQSRTAQRTQF